MSGMQSKITQRTNRSVKSLQVSREKTINGCQFQDDPNVEITKDFKTVLITVFHEVKENTPEMSKRKELFPEKWKLFFFKGMNSRTGK